VFIKGVIVSSRLLLMSSREIGAQERGRPAIAVPSYWSRRYASEEGRQV
jgi:hypothetical protein